jgi:hypothetical protein
MSTQTTPTVQATTRVRLGNGKFATTKHLFTGNGKEGAGNGHTPQIQVGNKDLQDWMKEARKAHFKQSVEKGKSLMLLATKALGTRDSAGALRAMWKDRYACACYLCSEKGKREHRFVPISDGFKELELMEEFLKAKAKEAGQEVPQWSPRK